MAFMLTSAFGRLALHTQSRPILRSTFSTALRGQQLQVPRRGFHTAPAVHADVVAKQNTLKRQRQAEKARVRNKSRKSAVKTRMKKVLTAIQTLEFDMPKSTNDLGTVEQLMAEAYKEIDKAVVNGTLHKNNGARKKSRLGRAKVKLLVDAGLYTPQPATA